MSQLPIRIRLTLVFAAAMAVVLAAIGTALYTGLSQFLNDQTDEALRVKAREVMQDVRHGGTQAGAPVYRVVVGEDRVAQVLGPDGGIIAASVNAPNRPLLTVAQQRSASSREVILDVMQADAFAADGARVLARPASAGDTRVIVVVGASREDRQDALNGLLRLLLIVGPIALVVVSGAGYLVAAGALRPVEQMREQAESISDETSGARLTLTRARDEIRRLGQTLNDMLARLESGRARERRFIADASHELRTPLALLRTELDLALRKPRSPDELRAALLSAADEVERLVMLSEDLLVLAAADERGIRLDRTDVPIADLIDAAVRRFSSRAAEDGRAFDTSIEPRGVTISADRLRLEQALGNLVDNALRHGDGTVTLRAEVSPAASPAGDSDGAVAHRGEITAAQGGSRVWLSVRDHGRGFPRDFLPHAFERFSRADAARTTGSAGLGLAIAEMIARAHGGGACAENAPDGGAIVSVWLPRDSS